MIITVEVLWIHNIDAICKSVTRPFSVFNSMSSKDSTTKSPVCNEFLIFGICRPFENATHFLLWLSFNLRNRESYDLIVIYSILNYLGIAHMSM